MMDWTQPNLPGNVQQIILWAFRLVIAVVISYYWARHYLNRQKREVEEAERMMQAPDQDQDKEE